MCIVTLAGGELVQFPELTLPPRGRLDASFEQRLLPNLGRLAPGLEYPQGTDKFIDYLPTLSHVVNYVCLEFRSGELTDCHHAGVGVRAGNRYRCNADRDYS
jgi:hypothetical protein